MQEIMICHISKFERTETKLTVLRTIGMKWKTAKEKQVTIVRRQS